MNFSGIRTLDIAPQVVAEWLNALCEDLGWSDRERAYRLLRETLHALRDNLSADQGADLATQLPILLRGLYYEGWDPLATPSHPRDKRSFLERVDAGFEKAPLENTERAVAAVFALLQCRMSAEGDDDSPRSFSKLSRKFRQ